MFAHLSLGFQQTNIGWNFRNCKLIFATEFFLEKNI
jgi:hypothetical protein